MDKPPEGKHSTKGCGKQEPDPTMVEKKDGYTIPLGKGVRTGGNNYSLEYNE